MSRTLAGRACRPCRRGDPGLSREEAAALLGELPAWSLSADGTRLERRIAVPDYARAFDLVARLSALAEAERHHPDVAFGWGYVQLSLTTHAIGGLSLNDVILAAKIDGLADPPPAPAT